MNDGIHFVAMWSGPRNISTAMMRAWENRPDTCVVDEPFYAHYLDHTGIAHPGAPEIIQAYETDWRKVADSLTSKPEDGSTVFFQKHMTLHMLDHMSLDWMEKVQSCFLIRNPQEVLTSYIKVRPDITLEDLGFPQQERLFTYVTKTLGQTPIVVDAKDVLLNPRVILSTICERLSIPFMEEMLSWPAGKRESDGNWAKYWYANVESSTQFAPYIPKNRPVPEKYFDILAACEASYAKLAQHKIKLDG